MGPVDLHAVHPRVAGARGRVTELFVTATTTEVMPVVSVDGAPVGDGLVGPVARALRAAWPAWVEAENAADDAADAAEGASAGRR